MARSFGINSRIDNLKVSLKHKSRVLLSHLDVWSGSVYHYTIDVVQFSVSQGGLCQLSILVSHCGFVVLLCRIKQLLLPLLLVKHGSRNVWYLVASSHSIAILLLIIATCVLLLVQALIRVTVILLLLILIVSMPVVVVIVAPRFPASLPKHLILRWSDISDVNTWIFFLKFFKPWFLLCFFDESFLALWARWASSYLDHFPLIYYLFEYFAH